MKIKFNVDKDSGEADWHPETLAKLMSYSPLWRVDVLGDVVAMATQLYEQAKATQLYEQASAEMLMEFEGIQNAATEEDEEGEAIH